MEFFLQIVLILACLFYGARKGGIALGLLGGIGIVVLVFAFKLPPGKPPVEVILTIVAVVAASPGYVVAFAAACYGYYILPTYPSDLATIQFDRSGTTHIGKYVINHSFIAPGLIGVFTSCVAGYFIAAARGIV